jgi:hypothetical protein
MPSRIRQIIMDFSKLKTGPTHSSDYNDDIHNLLDWHMPKYTDNSQALITQGTKRKLQFRAQSIITVNNTGTSEVKQEHVKGRSICGHSLGGNTTQFTTRSVSFAVALRPIGSAHILMPFIITYRSSSSTNSDCHCC